MVNRTRRTGRSAAARSGFGFSQFTRERPLLVVAAGVLVGMALGALLPWNRIEDELLGEQADKLKDSARELASEGFERVKSVAQRTYESATETLRGGQSTGGAGENAPVQSSQATKTATDPY